MGNFEEKIVWIIMAVLVGISSTYSIIALSRTMYRISYDFVDTYRGNDDEKVPVYNYNQALLASIDDIEIVEKKDKVSLVFVGDIMFDRGVESVVGKYGGGNFSYIFSNVSELKNADILFGNLEGPISDKGENVGSIYSFRMDPKVVHSLKDIGFDIVSIANNHIGDWGKDALSDTIDRLSNVKIESAGDLDRNYKNGLRIIERKGMSFGFLAFSDLGPSWLNTGHAPYVAQANTNYSRELIKNADDDVDILIVSYHFGNEYEKNPTKRQENIAEEAVDLGADIVIGHHPHVVQPVVSYKDAIIAYSLGNFIFDQYFSDETVEGLILEVTVSDGEIEKVRQGKSKQNVFYQPEIYAWCGEFVGCENE